MKYRSPLIGEQVFFEYQEKILFGEIRSAGFANGMYFYISCFENGYTIEASKVISVGSVAKHRIKKIFENEIS